MKQSGVPKALADLPLGKRLWRRHKGTLLSLLAVAVLLSLWEIVAVAMDKDYLLPRFSQVCVRFGLLWTTAEFYRATGYTLLRCLLGFGLSFAAGALLGIAGGVFPWVRHVLKPVVGFVRSAPTMALTLIIMVWFRQWWTPVCVGFLMVFPVIYTTIADSIVTTDADLLQMAKVYHMSRGKQIRYIYLPHILPMLFSAVSTAFALNIKATISAEILAYTTQSVGINMYIAKGNLLDGAATLFAWLLVAILLSVAFELLLTGMQRLLQRRYTHAH